MDLAARVTSWPPWVVFILITALLVASILGGVQLRRRLVSDELLARTLPVGTAMFTAVAMLYTVLLAFMVVGVWGEFNKARAEADQESAALLSISRLAQAYPDPGPEVRNLRRALLAYAESVTLMEYPAMGRQQDSPETDQAMAALWHAAGVLTPATPQQINLHSKILEQMVAAQSARMARIMTSSRGMPGILWVVILGFTGLTLGFSVVLSAEGLWVERFMVGAFALAAGLVIFAIVQLNYPFIGGVTVTNKGFNQTLRFREGGPTLMELLK